MDMGFLLGWCKHFRAIMRLSAQHGCQWTVHFKMVSFLLCEFHLNL
jgi:hypothetical protein